MGCWVGALRGRMGMEIGREGCECILRGIGDGDFVMHVSLKVGWCLRVFFFIVYNSIRPSQANINSHRVSSCLSLLFPVAPLMYRIDNFSQPSR